MKILYIHNDYAKPSGEETAATAIVNLLQEHGHEVRWFRRSSAEIKGVSGKIKSFFTGLANPAMAKALGKILDEYQPDLVQVQNIYPFLSPSIFKPIKKRNIPIVMRCPNYRLFCPNGLCCDMKGKVCERCFGGHEWNCILKNCTGSRFKSLGYALRGWFARVTKRILKNVDIFIVQTEFQKRKFMGQSIPEEQIGILPGIMQKMEPPQVWEAGKYVTFVGRVSEEKGIYEFLESAKQHPEIPFLVAGAYDGMPGIRENAPANVEWRGFIKGEDLRKAYLESRMVVVPSRCYEGFPNVIVQAMQLERPVIAVDLGASGAVVENGITGLKFAPGNVEELSTRIKEFYDDAVLCQKIGKTGRETALKLYSRESIYEQLMQIYQRALSR
ncbi:MAG: glycosyltransferase family 4 protein [Lentisphaeria bacterium]|nr:glycosyltransferase family 4 protein [Lentisphaeria bacterium]